MPLLPGRSTSLSLILGVFIGISISISSSSLALYFRKKREERRDHEYHVPRPIQLRRNKVLRDGVVGLIGESTIYIYILSPYFFQMIQYVQETRH